MKSITSHERLLELFPTFDDLPSNLNRAEDRDLIRAIAGGRHREDLILHGANGTGKSSLAELLAYWNCVNSGREYYPYVVDAISMDADKISTSHSYSPLLYGQVRWIVINEFDKITERQQCKLLTTIGAIDDCKFILTANDVLKVNEGFLSRCEAIETVAPSPEQYALFAAKKLTAAGRSIPLIEITKQMSEVGGDLRAMERRLTRLINL